MVNSKRVTDLLPEVEELYWKFSLEMAKIGLSFVVTSTYRDQEYQEYLYQQGRTRPGNVITWTKKSKHCTRKAFDIALFKTGKLHYDTKISVNENDIPDYVEAGNIWKSLNENCIWGGDFKTIDMCHFELK